jgi:hypothetical protein
MVRLVLNLAEKLLVRRPTLLTPKVFAECLEASLLNRLRLAALAISADRNIDDVLLQSYLCTVLIAVVTPHWTAVMGCGDGFYAINGEVVEIPPRPGNQPEYLAYKLFSQIPKGFERIGIKVLKAVDTLDVSSVVIATDGIEPIARRRNQGFSLADVWEKPQFRDPAAVLSELSRLSEDRVESQMDKSVYPPQGRVVTIPGIFADDTTIVYLVRDRDVLLPAEWITYRTARGLKLPEALRKSTTSWFGFGRKSNIQTTEPSVAIEPQSLANPYVIDTQVAIAETKRKRSLFGICVTLLEFLFRTPKSGVPKNTQQRSSQLSNSKKERKW